jgi:hypothetical protein
MAAKLTRLTHKIAIQLHLVAESCTICSSRSRRPVRKLLVTPSYLTVLKILYVCETRKLTYRYKYEYSMIKGVSLQRIFLQQLVFILLFEKYSIFIEVEASLHSSRKPTALPPNFSHFNLLIYCEVLVSHGYEYSSRGLLVCDAV